MRWNYKDIVRWAVSRALVRSGEEPGFPAESNAAEPALGGIIREADAAIVEKARERIPALQHVMHGLRDVGMTREASTFGTHPLLERCDQRHDPDLSYRVSLRCRQPVDLALDIEDRINPAHRLDRQGRLCHIGEHEQFASPMRPARRFGNRTGLTGLVIQIVESGIRVRLKNARVALEMLARMLPTAVG
jgi:hypothetical protein